MNLFTKKLFISILVLVFSASFIVMYFVFSLTPYAYSEQKDYSTPSLSPWPSMVPYGISLGPAINSTNVPLDTTIIIDEIRSIKVSNVSLTPEIPIERQNIEGYGLASQQYIFYLAQPLKPSTNYTVAAFFGAPADEVSWSFTTTSEAISQRYIAVYEETRVLDVSFLAAIVSTLATGLLVYFKKRRH
jgi:hypothetical protein